ncbi:MAG: DNA-directed RNA polymerase subunit alpha [Thermomicrobiales bacterium]
MLERPGFTIETVTEGENYGRYRVEPLEPGYGTTLGNALRRILLRSLEGVAISRVRIDGVWHEFSTVKDVREDVTELVLNLKKVRLRRVMDINGDVRAHLYVRGDGSGDKVVTAGDVAWPTEVDVINPDQAIATLTAPDAVLDVDLWVNRGRGYREAETQETFALGEIPIDAIYTPIQKVNYVVEHTRVGQQTDYDSLILEILTDGTIEPNDALAEAAQILVEHAKVFADFNRAPSAAETASGPSIPEEVQNTRLTDLGLSPRVTNALRSRGIETVGHVLSIDADTLMSIRNFGPRSLNELRDKLIEYGYWPEDAQIGGVDAEVVGDDEDIDDMAAALRALQERGIGGDLDDEE